MPISAAQGTLQVAGDTLTANLGNTGVGQPGDQLAIMSLSGVFASATIAFEGVPLGQPMQQGNPPSPASTQSWASITEINLGTNQSLVSPVGPISSTGLPGSALPYSVSIAAYSMVRLRLISIGSGAIQGGIATSPFPIGGANSALTVALLTNLLLELQRTRIGIGVLIDTDLLDAVPAGTTF